MLKEIEPSWNFGEPINQQVPLLKSGALGPGDRQFLIKRAGDQAYEEFRKVDFQPGEIPLHCIALGSHEGWHCNRNGDSFKESVCRSQHPTFVKYARWYRHHKNQDPSKSYGRIKASFYNEDMRRVELLIALNGTKEAAEHNEGLVADLEKEALDRGEDLATSMSCVVSHDICSSCNNHAKTRNDYCDEDSCIGPLGEKRGGCKRHLAKVAADGHQNCVFNPGATFFDQSLVVRPADRTAFSAPADWLKAASDGVPGGAWLAEHHGLSAPLAVMIQHYGQSPSPNVHTQLLCKLAAGMAQLEQEPRNPLWKMAFSPAVHVVLDTSRLGQVGSSKAAAGLGALADERVVLTLPEFAAWMHGPQSQEMAKAAEAHLPGIFTSLLLSGELSNRVDSMRAMLPSDAPASAVQRHWAKQAAAHRGFDQESLEDRSMLAVLRRGGLPTPAGHCKTASDMGRAESLAKDYAVYQLGTLGRIAQQGESFHLTAASVLLQNSLSVPGTT